MTTTPITYKLQRLAAALAVAAIAAFAGVSVACADNSTVANVNFVSLSSSTVVADGTSTSTLKVCASDASSNPVVDATLTFSASPNPTFGKPSAIFDAPVNLGDGCYTDTVHSLGAYTPNVSAYVPSGPSSIPQPVQFIPGPATRLFCNQSPVSPTDMDGTATITCNAADANNNLETTGGDTVSLSIPAGAGSLSAPTDNGNGNYTWTRTLPSYRVGSGFISPTINGSSSGSSVAAGVYGSAASTLGSGSTFDRIAGTSCAGTYDLMTRCVYANYVDPTNAPADGSSIDAISFSLLDKFKQPGASDAATAVVACSTTIPGATITKINRGSGNYWLYITSTTAGTGTVSCTINGTPAANVATVSFAAVAAPTPPPTPAPPAPPADPAPAPAPPPPPPPAVGISNSGDSIGLDVNNAPPGSHAIWEFTAPGGNDWISIGDGNSIVWDAHCVPTGQYLVRARLAEADGTTTVLDSKTLTITHSEAPLPAVAIADVRRDGNQFTLDASKSYAIGGSRPVCVSWLVNGQQVSDKSTTTITLNKPAQIELIVRGDINGYRRTVMLGAFGYRKHLVAVAMPQQTYGSRSSEIGNVLNQLDPHDAQLARIVWLRTARALGHGHRAGEYGLQLRSGRLTIVRSPRVWQLLGAVKGGKLTHIHSLDAVVQVSQRAAGRPTVRQTQFWLFDH